MLKKNGFTLVEVMIALALLGGASVIFMQLNRNVEKEQSNAFGKSDYLDMKREIEFYLSDEASCRASFAEPNSEIIFEGSSIKNTPVGNLEIWTADSNGKRSNLKFKAGQNYGKIKLQSINFSMPDHNSGQNFPANTVTSFRGEIKIKTDRKILDKTKSDQDITIPLNVSFHTTIDGKSHLLNCSVNKIQDQNLVRHGFCTPAVGPDNNNTGNCPTISNYNVRKITACIPGTLRAMTCCYVPSNDDSEGWCSESMEGWNGCFSGCGANDSNYFVQHINGRSSGQNDTHTCCFIPKKIKNVKPFSTGKYNSWDSHSGCVDNITDYNVIETNVITPGVGNQTSCTYVPKIQ